MQLQDGFHLFAVRLPGPAAGVVAVRVHEKDQHRPLDPHRRLDDVRVVLAVVGLVEIGEVPSGELLVLPQVVVGAVGHAGQFTPAERKIVLQVHGALRVMRQRLRRMLVAADVLRRHAQVGEEALPRLQPDPEPLPVGPRLDEVLDLRDLELPQAEEPLPRGDLVAEGLPDLGDAEGHLHAGGVQDVLEIGEHALGRLGAQVGQGGALLRGPQGGLEHQVELLGLGEVVLVIRRRRDLLVGAEALVADAALHQRVVKSRLMPRGRQHLAPGDDGALDADDVLALLDEAAPPLPADVVAQLHPQRSKVVDRTWAAVELRGGVDETPPLGQGRDAVQLVGARWRIHRCGERAGCGAAQTVGRKGRRPQKSSPMTRAGDHPASAAARAAARWF